MSVGKDSILRAANADAKKNRSKGRNKTSRGSKSTGKSRSSSGRLRKLLQREQQQRRLLL